MGNDLLISIIIAAYNAAPHLPCCLRSIQEQRYLEMEVLVQDGGSTDETLKVLRNFASDGLNLRWSSEPDSGIYDAINKVLPEAGGELIVILGADDALAPGALQRVSSVAAVTPGDIYAGKALCIHPDWQGEFKVDPCDSRVLILSTPFCHNAMFARRAAYDKIGYYSTDYRLAADTQWIHRAIKNNLKFVPVDAVLAHFYAGGASSDPHLVMEESYKLLRENFPQISLEDAKYLLHMGKGWESAEKLDEVLARYPGDLILAESAHLAAEYAPQSAQRLLDNAAAKRLNKRNSSILKKIYEKIFRERASAKKNNYKK